MARPGDRAGAGGGAVLRPGSAGLGAGPGPARTARRTTRSIDPGPGRKGIRDLLAIADAAERLAFLQARPDREDIRMVVGVLRSGESWCALRSRAHDDDASVYQGEQLVPGLVEALATTFL